MSRSVGHVLGIVLGLSFGGWDSSEAVDEALLVVPGNVVGGEVFEVAEGAQGAAAKRRIGPDALVLVEPDRGLGQRIVQSRQLRSIPSLVSELFG